MIRWRFFEPNPMRDMLDQWLQEMPRRWRGELGRGEPMRMNVHETADATIIEAEMPGVKPEDVEITGNEGVLSIRARSMVEDKDYHHQEIYSVEYQRQLTMPADVRLDQARAEFENGILTIRLPKPQPKAPEKVRIEVTGGQRTEGAIEAAKGQGYSEVESGRSADANGGAGTSGRRGGGGSQASGTGSASSAGGRKKPKKA